MTRRFLPLAGLLVLPALIASTAHAEDGQAVYNSNCSVCHQAAGAGSPGQFPPLAGRIGKIAATAEGKTYVADVLLNGVHGTIDAAGSSYMGFMPSFKALTDDQLAAVLTYISSIDTPGAPAFRADEVKAARATPKKAKEILAERKALNDAHPLP
ncbi:c-type cytochrome [Asaia krungthepensis]|uniref:Cytochrome c-552 class I n=1 Tax=Asaia krungthepensis NRIC 0535 TaxID=1307925 RepID=A0ABQ0PVF3_9PROT|nr:cytochrome c [Asaia krungthepensis]GBQ82595.1 cytochrome c-552 class I [Asaia krungthepensis NRIC 0535]